MADLFTNTQDDGGGVDGEDISSRMLSPPDMEETSLVSIQTLLKYLGIEGRPGTEETPHRLRKVLQEFRVKVHPPEVTLFEQESDTLVMVSDIPFFSFCEHHLLPFFGTAAVAYIPDGKIIGLSKIPRIVEHFSRQPQNQERITTQVADFLHIGIRDFDPLGVAVVLRARHMCMEMRGVRAYGTYTVTSALKGEFLSQGDLRSELVQLLKS